MGWWRQQHLTRQAGPVRRYWLVELAQSSVQHSEVAERAAVWLQSVLA